LLKFKEGDNKDSGFWFKVPGSWLKEKTRNYKPETRNQVFKEIGQKGVLCKGRGKESINE